MIKEDHKKIPDFIELRQRFDSLEPGRKAELRRVAKPADLSLITALYRLFPGVRPDERHRRVAFFLPWCVQSRSKPRDFSRQLTDKKVSGTRVLQMARASYPVDLIQFRRIVMHVEPEVDWSRFGPMLWFWGIHNKRRFVEDFYLAEFNAPKGGRK